MGLQVNRTNPSFWKQLRQAKGFTKKQIAVGFPRGKAGSVQYPDGTALLDVVTSNEYGTDTAPPRPFVRTTAKILPEKTKPLIRDLTLKIQEGKIAPEAAVGQIGAVAQAEMQRVISEWTTPPNAPSTSRDAS